MSLKKVIFIGCGTVLLIAVVLIGLLVGWLMYVSQDVQGMTVSINSPLDVKVGETFELKVNVKNERSKQLTVSDVDIADSYLTGLVIISTDPVPKSTMHVPIDNSLSHTFDADIAAGATKTFTFVLRAEQAGIFRGDVDVCEGSRFITATAQTVVKAEPIRSL